MAELSNTGRDYQTRMSASHEPAHTYPFMHFQHAPVNVGNMERLASIVAGGGMLLAGLAKRSAGGLALSAIGGALAYRGFTGHCHLYGALGMSTIEHPEATAVPAQAGFKVEKSITVNRPKSELFAFWRDLESLPQVMHHLKRVEKQGETRSHWVAKGALGKDVEWDAEIINIRQDEMISWGSLPGGDVETAGSVHFDSLPNGRGTSVRVTLKYNPPAGKAGATLAGLFGEGLQQKLDEDLQRFKQHMEAGETATTEGQPRGEI